jgi:hypothetical protein
MTHHTTEMKPCCMLNFEQLLTFNEDNYIVKKMLYVTYNLGDQKYTYSIQTISV